MLTDAWTRKNINKPVRIIFNNRIWRFWNEFESSDTRNLEIMNNYFSFQFFCFEFFRCNIRFRQHVVIWLQFTIDFNTIIIFGSAFEYFVSLIFFSNFVQ